MIMCQKYHALINSDDDDAKNTAKHVGHVTRNPELPLHADLHSISPLQLKHL